MKALDESTFWICKEAADVTAMHSAQNLGSQQLESCKLKPDEFLGRQQLETCQLEEA